RGRHTRSKRDWSSDVCSSDLTSKCGFPKHKKEEAALLMYKRLIYRFNRITLPGGMARNLVPAHHQRARSNRCAGMNMTCWQCDRSEERRVGRECRYQTSAQT